MNEQIEDYKLDLFFVDINNNKNIINENHQIIKELNLIKLAEEKFLKGFFDGVMSIVDIKNSNSIIEKSHMIAYKWQYKTEII